MSLFFLIQVAGTEIKLGHGTLTLDVGCCPWMEIPIGTPTALGCYRICCRKSLSVEGQAMHASVATHANIDGYKFYAIIEMLYNKSYLTTQQPRMAIATREGADLQTQHLLK